MIFAAHGEESQAEESAAPQITALKKVGPMWGRYTRPTRRDERHEANLMVILK
jgi:hypothetical protein